MYNHEIAENVCTIVQKGIELTLDQLEVIVAKTTLPKNFEPENSKLENFKLENLEPENSKPSFEQDLDKTEPNPVQASTLYNT